VLTLITSFGTKSEKREEKERKERKEGRNVDGSRG
jgi:hypothetical protein